MRVVNKVTNNRQQLVSMEDFAAEYYEYHNTSKRWKNYFSDTLSNLTSLTRQKNGDQKAFLDELIEDYEHIIKATAKELDQIIQYYTISNYSGLLYDNDSQTQFGREIENAFNYKNFRSSAKVSWFADRLGMKSCLYCNAQFTLAVGNAKNKKRLLFQLDHFFSKSRYPFLSLTLGNLIPVCVNCNISKSDGIVSMNSFIHPYYEDANTGFNFKINQDKALLYIIDNRNPELLYPYLEVHDPRINNHKKVFHLEELYKKHTDVIEEIILKSIYYNKSKREEIKSEFTDLVLTDSIIDRFVLGNYSLDSEINKRPLSKLTKDIAKQLKLI